MALPGQTIREVLQNSLPAELRDHQHIVVFNKGVEIRDVDHYYVNEHDRLAIYLVPQGGGGGGKGGGGKGILSIVLAAVIIAVAWWNPMGWAAGSWALTSMYAVGASLALSGVASLISPTPSLNTNTPRVNDTAADSSYYGFTGQSNQPRHYKPVLKLYGRHRMFPALASVPEVRNIGSESTIRALYDWGIGNVQIEDVRVGDTPYNQFGISLNTHYNTARPNLAWTGSRLAYDQYSYDLKQNSPITVRTKVDTIEAVLDIQFPRGLVYYNDQGGMDQRSVSLDVKYRRVGTSAWNEVPSNWFFGASVATNYYWATRTYNRFDVPDAYTKTNGVFEEYNQDDWGNGYSVDAYYYNGMRFTTNAGSSSCEAEWWDGGWRRMTLRKGAANSVTVGGGWWGPTTVSGWNVSYDEAYQVAGDDAVITAASPKPFVVSVQMRGLAAGEYEIYVNRTSPVATSNREYNQTVLTLLKSYRAGGILNLKTPHTMTEFYAVATDRLSGTVQNLNAIATSILPHYDAAGNFIGAWPTRNPAWIALDILLGPANPRPVQAAMIDWPAWRHLADVCDSPRTWNIGGNVATAPRYVADFVLDYQSTVKEILDSLLSTCRASVTIGLDGKYSVMIDQEKTIPRQMLTTANTWDFTGSREFPPQVHALKVSFVSSEADYQKQEVVVYNDGYNASNATAFEDVGTFAITDFWHAWAFGRYHLAAIKHRSEVFTCKMDVENLAFSRGDLVAFAHDVPQVGGVPTKVVTVQGNTVTIAERLGQMPTGYSVRLQDGTIRQGAVSASVDADTFTLDNAGDIHPDDLIILGEPNRVVKYYLVQGIAPEAELNATITLVPYVPAIYDADIGLIPPWQPDLSDDILNTTDLVVKNLSAAQKLTYIDRMPFVQVDLNWQVDGFGYGKSEVYLRADGVPEKYLGSSDLLTYQHLIDAIKEPMYIGREVTFEVIPYNEAGIRGTPASVSITPMPDTQAPGPVNWFLVNVQDMTVSISWEPPADQDIQEYELRYSPLVTGATWNAGQLLGRFAHNVTRTMVGARTGTYMIAVRDTSGNLSDVYWRRTTIEQLPSVNLIESVNDAPLWNGTLGGVAKTGTKVHSEGDWGSVAPDGYYYYESIFDAGEIYELRVSSKLQSHGMTFADFMVNWTPLASARPLARALSSQYNVVLEVRTANNVTMMADWVPLSSPEADPIGGAETGAWSPWRPCEVGDFTGRLFQFRARLQSFDPYVRAVLDDGLVEIDVRDRVDSYSDVAVGTSGTTINFNPAFMEPPTLAVTTENSAAIRYEISNKTRTGFSVQLFDENGPVAGQIDVLALGYGRERPTSI